MHHSDRMHRGDRQSHRAAAAGAPYPPPPGPGSTVTRIASGHRVSTAGTALERGYECVSTRWRRGWPERPAGSRRRGAFCRGRCVGVLDGDLGAFWLDLANWGQTRHGVRRAR